MKQKNTKRKACVRRQHSIISPIILKAICKNALNLIKVPIRLSWKYLGVDLN